MEIHTNVWEFIQEFRINQRSDGTIKLVTDEENVWVIQ